MQNSIKEQLENEFEAKATIQGDKVKITVPKVSGNKLLKLSNIYSKKGVKDVELKRSGTSITILVMV